MAMRATPPCRAPGPWPTARRSPWPATSAQAGRQLRHELCLHDGHQQLRRRHPFVQHGRPTGAARPALPSGSNPTARAAACTSSSWKQRRVLGEEPDSCPEPPPRRLSALLRLRSPGLVQRQGGNGVVDLGAISQFSLFVNQDSTAAGSSTIYLDDSRPAAAPSAAPRRPLRRPRPRRRPPRSRRPRRRPRPRPPPPRSRRPRRRPRPRPRPPRNPPRRPTPRRRRRRRATWCRTPRSRRPRPPGR